jgi:PAS domain S-box-containing protein
MGKGFVQKIIKRKNQDLLCSIIKKHYPLILEDLRRAVFCIDKNGAIVFANTEAAAVFKMTIEQFYRLKNISNLWKAAWITTGKSDLLPFEKTPFQQALRTGNPQTETFVLLTESGVNRYVRFECLPLFEKDGTKPFAVVITITDTTKRKKIPDAFKQIELSETIIQVQENERTRIGHELHDNVNQILTSVKLFLDMMHPVSTEEIEIKSKSSEYIRRAIEEIRKLSRELVVPELKDRTLVESIKTLVEDIQTASPIKINFSHDPEKDLLNPAKRLTVFRIIQEQLKNILKYSEASEVLIDLRFKNEEAHLTINANGIGFDPEKTRRGVGLSNIHERTRFYNGSTDIQTAPGEGCLLRVIIPVKE